MRSKVDQPASDINWIVVRMTDAPDNEAVLEYAAREAKLRQARFLADHDERVQLAVIGGGEAGQLARLVGPSGHPVFRHAECSVLVVRR